MAIKQCNSMKLFFWIIQIILDGEIVSMEVVVFENIYNFIVDYFFIWNNLGLEIVF
jgi:hypothetical protein